MLKKIMTIILSTAMVISVGGIEIFAASGECVQESGVELVGDAASFSKAIPLVMGNTINGAITETEEEQVYSFSLASSGRVTFNMTAYMEDHVLQLYDAQGKEIWSKSNRWNENLQYVANTYTIDLSKGFYYLCVSGGLGAKGTFTLASSFLSANVTYDEENNDFAFATAINAGNTINGQIAINDSEDIYKITFAKPGRLSMNITSYIEFYSISIYDSQGERIWNKDGRYWNKNLQYITESWDVDLSADTYYVAISEGTYTGNYILDTSFKEAGETITEPNNDFTTACRLNLNREIKGQIAEDDDKDMFTFTLNNAVDLGIAVTSYMENYGIYVYNSNGECVWESTGNHWNENVNYRSDNWKVALSAGIYYLEINGRGGRIYYSDCTGNYTLQIGTMPSMRDVSVASIGNKIYTGDYIKPSMSVTYNGKRLTEGVDYTVSYNNNLYPGKATVTITGTGAYTGTKEVSFKILPKKQVINYCYNSSKRTAYLQWSYASGISGYEVYRSTSKSSGYKRCYTTKNANSSSVYIKKLKKGKRYYFKVRSYVVIDGKRYYGKFSSVKSVRIKK